MSGYVTGPAPKLPALTPILSSLVFAEAAKNKGWHPFPRPSANASRAYTNPDGQTFGACQYCGYCQRFGCEANAKGSPHVAIIPVAMRNPNFELRTHSWVTKVLKDRSGRRVTGVAYTNLMNGEEFEQPADMVLLCAYAINNVHLMLLSEIGQPYDPVTQRGVIGKNYCYQTGAAANLFFEGRRFNPFMNAGGFEDFRYSPAMKRSNITWTPEELDRFIADPQAVVPANRMPYAGMTNATDRADLIAYLQKAAQ